MKIRIESEDNIVEDEVIIRCHKIDDTIQKIQHAISEITNTRPKLSFFKEDIEYYLLLDDILFFETENNRISAHTADDVYQIKYRLYELEELLPHKFLRVSKSTILNIEQIFSIDRNLTSSNLIKFYKSYKQVYVSRYYFKDLRNRLGERRNYEN